MEAAVRSVYIKSQARLSPVFINSFTSVRMRPLQWNGASGKPLVVGRLEQLAR